MQAADPSYIDEHAAERASLITPPPTFVHPARKVQKQATSTLRQQMQELYRVFGVGQTAASSIFPHMPDVPPSTAIPITSVKQFLKPHKETVVPRLKLPGVPAGDPRQHRQERNFVQSARDVQEAHRMLAAYQLAPQTARNESTNVSRLKSNLQSDELAAIPLTLLSDPTVWQGEIEAVRKQLNPPPFPSGPLSARSELPEPIANSMRARAAAHANSHHMPRQAALHSPYTALPIPATGRMATARLNTAPNARLPTVTPRLVAIASDHHHPHPNSDFEVMNVPKEVLPRRVDVNGWSSELSERAMSQSSTEPELASEAVSHIQPALHPAQPVVPAGPYFDTGEVRPKTQLSYAEILKRRQQGGNRGIGRISSAVDKKSMMLRFQKEQEQIELNRVIEPVKEPAAPITQRVQTVAPRAVVSVPLEPFSVVPRSSMLSELSPRSRFQNRVKSSDGHRKWSKQPLRSAPRLRFEQDIQQPVQPLPEDMKSIEEPEMVNTDDFIQNPTEPPEHEPVESSIQTFITTFNETPEIPGPPPSTLRRSAVMTGRSNLASAPFESAIDDERAAQQFNARPYSSQTTSKVSKSEKPFAFGLRPHTAQQPSIDRVEEAPEHKRQDSIGSTYSFESKEESNEERADSEVGIDDRDQIDEAAVDEINNAERSDDDHHSVASDIEGSVAPGIDAEATAESFPASIYSPWEPLRQAELRDAVQALSDDIAQQTGDAQRELVTEAIDHLQLPAHDRHIKVEPHRMNDHMRARQQIDQTAAPKYNVSSHRAMGRSGLKLSTASIPLPMAAQLALPSSMRTPRVIAMLAGEMPTGPGSLPMRPHLIKRQVRPAVDVDEFQYSRVQPPRRAQKPASNNLPQPSATDGMVSPAAERWREALLNDNQIKVVTPAVSPVPRRTPTSPKGSPRSPLHMAAASPTLEFVGNCDIGSPVIINERTHLKSTRPSPSPPPQANVDSKQPDPLLSLVGVVARRETRPASSIRAAAAKYSPSSPTPKHGLPELVPKPAPSVPWSFPEQLQRADSTTEDDISSIGSPPMSPFVRSVSLETYAKKEQSELKADELALINTSVIVPAEQSVDDAHEVSVILSQEIETPEQVVALS